MKPVLLIVDDEESVRESFRLILQDDYDLIFAEDAKATLRLLKHQTFNLCLLDIMLPDGSGLDLLRQIKRRDQSIDVIMVTALQGVDTALDAMKGEAQDYITKPFKVDQLRALIKKVLARAQEQKNRLWEDGTGQPKPLCLTGTSQGLQELVKKMEAVSERETPVCLVAEAGAGAEAEDIAREIHLRSGRKNGPFITMNGSSRSEQRLERELFGEDTKDKLTQIGKLEFAAQGTLFLKQIDRLPPRIQSKLRSVFAKKTMVKPGSRVRIPMDARLIVSSDADLAGKAAKGLFDKHLYPFLGQDTLFIPALRERKEDIPAMVEQILKTVNLKAKIPVKKIHKKVFQFLAGYPWPGNLSELENCVEIMARFAGKETLTMEDIPLDILIKQMSRKDAKGEGKLSLKRVGLQFERKYIRKVLENTRGHQTLTAKALGLNRNTLIWKLKELDLQEDYKKIVRKRRKQGIGFQGL